MSRKYKGQSLIKKALSRYEPKTQREAKKLLKTYKKAKNSYTIRGTKYNKSRGRDTLLEAYSKGKSLKSHGNTSFGYFPELYNLKILPP